jgi:hypothetical protein
VDDLFIWSLLGITKDIENEEETMPKKKKDKKREGILICSNYEWFTKAEEEPVWPPPPPIFLIRVNLYIYIFLFRKVNKTLQFMFKQKGVWYGGVQQM